MSNQYVYDATLANRSELDCAEVLRQVHTVNTQ